MNLAAERVRRATNNLIHFSTTEIIQASILENINPDPIDEALKILLENDVTIFPVITQLADTSLEDALFSNDEFNALTVSLLRTLEEVLAERRARQIVETTDPLSTLRVLLTV